MSTDSPKPRLADFLRGREGDLSPLVLKIVDAILDKDHPPPDVQTAALTAAAFTIFYLTPSKKLRHRTRDAEQMLGRLVKAHEARARELGSNVDGDILRGLQEGGVLTGFTEILRKSIASQPIPPRFVEAGVTSPEYLREVLLADAVQNGLADLYASAFGEQIVDRAACSIATIHAAAIVVAGLYETKSDDDDRFADDVTSLLRGTLMKCIGYYREREAS